MTATYSQPLFNPRRELMTLASAALEICWVYGFFEVALYASGHAQRGVSVWLFAGLVLFAIYSTRFVLNSAWPLSRQQVVIVTLALVSIVMAMRLTLFSNSPLADLTWLGRIPLAIANLLIMLSAESLVLVMAVFGWWRGLSLAQAAMDFESVGFRFRLGVLMIALLALINTWIGHIDLTPLLFAFFFFGLLAVALARQEDVSAGQPNVSLPLKGPWLAILAGSALLVLGLGVLVASMLTPQGVRALFDLLRPLEPLIVVILYVILLMTSYLVEMIYNILYALMRNFINLNPNNPLLQLPQRPPPELIGSANGFDALAPYWDPIRMLCAVLLFASVLMLLAFSLDQLKKRERDGAHEKRESVPVALDWHPLDRLRRLFRRTPSAHMDAGVASIRRIYANLTRLAAQRGYPRHDAETPYEFMRELRVAIPGGEPDERLITEAYVHVHYGEHAPSDEEVAEVREAWEKIKGGRMKDEG